MKATTLPFVFAQGNQHGDEFAAQVGVTLEHILDVLIEIIVQAREVVVVVAGEFRLVLADDAAGAGIIDFLKVVQVALILRRATQLPA